MAAAASRQHGLERVHCYTGGTGYTTAPAVNVTGGTARARLRRLRIWVWSWAHRRNGHRGRNIHWSSYPVTFTQAGATSGGGGATVDVLTIGVTSGGAYTSTPTIGFSTPNSGQNRQARQIWEWAPLTLPRLDQVSRGWPGVTHNRRRRQRRIDGTATMRVGAVECAGAGANVTTMPALTFTPINGGTGAARSRPPARDALTSVTPTNVRERQWSPPVAFSSDNHGNGGFGARWLSAFRCERLSQRHDQQRWVWLHLGADIQL